MLKNIEAAGADLYACLDAPVTIAPGESVFVPTGLSMEIPVGFAGLIYARSGLATKRGLAPANKVGVIDSDYTGEVIVGLLNTSDKPFTVEPGDRVAQLGILPVCRGIFVPVDELDKTDEILLDAQLTLIDLAYYNALSAELDRRLGHVRRVVEAEKARLKEVSAQIDEMDKWEGSQLNQAKEILAYELTALVHGTEEAEKAQASAKALFAGGAAAEMPTAELTDADFVDGSIDLLSVVQKSGLCASRSEARRNVEQGGVAVDGEIVKDIKAMFTKEQFAGDGIVVKRGKKNFRRVVVK